MSFGTTNFATTGGALAARLTATGHAPINFDTAVGFSPQEVMPDPEDDLEEILVKAKKWKKIVEEGKSLAVAFGWLEAGTGNAGREEDAMQGLTEGERELYEDWKARGAMPPFNVNTDKSPVTGGKGSQDRWKVRAEALNILYKVTPAQLAAGQLFTAENAVAFFKKYEAAIPLVTAVVAVKKFEVNLRNGQDRDARDVQEQRAVRFAIATEATAVKEYMERVNKLTGDLAHNMAPLQARAVAVAPTTTKAGKKAVPENARRTLLGKAAIGKPVNYGLVEGAGRRQRAGMAGVGQGFQAAPPSGGGPPPSSSVAGPSRNPYLGPRAPSPSYRPRSPMEEEEEDLRTGTGTRRDKRPRL